MIFSSQQLRQVVESQVNQYDPRNVGLLAIQPPDAVASPKIFYWI